MLPAADQEFLAGKNLRYTVMQEGGMTCVLVAGFKLPPGLNVTEADLLLRLSPGYPDVAPDMWWFDPPVRRRDGSPFAATESMESYVGRSWQRWSRHFNGGQWMAGVDSLESYLALVMKELASGARSAA